MSFNGAGTYSAPGASFPAVATTLIESAKYNAVINDIASALSICVTKDGQQTITADMPMSSHKFTGLAAGTAAGDSVRYEQVGLLAAANTWTASQTISGTGLRIFGDFSNATRSNRLSFQSSTTNDVTVVQAFPNGTSTQAVYQIYNASDMDNASVANMFVNATEVRWTSTITGTGTQLPHGWYVGSTRSLSLSTSGTLTCVGDIVAFGTP